MANKNYVNPYVTVNQQYKDGLDYIITNYVPGVTTEEGLVEIIFNYLNTIYSFGDIEAQMATKSVTANAMNGYLNSGVGVYNEFRNEPVRYLSSYFERIEESMQTASTYKSPADKHQFAITFGKASNEYWVAQLALPVSPWSAHLSGNSTVDLLDIPFWISAAMFGSNYCYDAINADDARAISTIFITTLAGSLAITSGKILFKWVPKQ